MSTEVAGTPIYHATVTFPDDGDARNATTLGAALQDLTDRTAALHDKPSGDTSTIGAGATQNVAGTLEITDGGILGVSDGGAIDVESGGDINVESGGDINVESGGAINADGNINIDSGGRLIVNSGGQINELTGAAHTHSSGSTENHASGSTDTYESGSTLALDGTVNIGATATVTEAANATIDEGGMHTQTGPRYLRGDGRIHQRVIAGPDANASFDGRSGDVVIVESSGLSDDRTYSLLVSGSHGTRLRFVNYDALHAVRFASAAAIFMPTNYNPGSTGLRNASSYAMAVEFMYSDGSAGAPAAGWYVIGHQMVP